MTWVKLNAGWRKFSSVMLACLLIGRVVYARGLVARSRMKREFHVRFCERFWGKFPEPTRLSGSAGRRPRTVSVPRQGSAGRRPRTVRVPRQADTRTVRYKKNNFTLIYKKEKKQSSSLLPTGLQPRPLLKILFFCTVLSARNNTLWLKEGLKAGKQESWEARRPGSKKARKPGGYKILRASKPHSLQALQPESWDARRPESREVTESFEPSSIIAFNPSSIISSKLHSLHASMPPSLIASKLPCLQAS